MVCRPGGCTHETAPARERFVRMPRSKRFGETEKIARCIVVSGVAVLLAASAHAFEFPATRAGKVAQAYIESYNSGDLAKMAAFVSEYRTPDAVENSSPEERAQRTLGLYNQVGAFEPVKVKDASETALTLIVRSPKMNMWLSCAFELEEQEPYRLRQIRIMPTSAPEDQPSNDFDWEAARSLTLNDLIEKVRAHHEIPALGAVFIENGEVREVAVAGFRDAGANTAVQRDDAFHIGSIGKSMTATLIGRLVELEVLDWTTTVGEVVDDIAMHEAYAGVTVEELLQHRSGLQGSQTFDDEDEVRLNAGDLDATGRRVRFLHEVLPSEPIGPRGVMAYSNAGYVLVAHMAELRSGRSWEDLIHEHVFVPMGFKRTGFGMPATTENPAAPRGHVRTDGRYTPAELTPPYPHDAFIAPAGNLHASVEDLARYAAQHLAGLGGQDGVVHAGTFARLHAVPGDARTGYAAGWMVEESDFGVLHTHGGSAGTFFAVVSLYPDHGCGVVVAMNIGPEGLGVAEQLTQHLMRRALQAAR